MADTKIIIEKVKEVSPIIDGKLYGIYSIVSKKTIRAKEKHLVRFFKRNKNLLGSLVKTGRGYFIDGYNVDLKSVDNWAFNNESTPGAGDGLTVFKPKKR